MINKILSYGLAAILSFGIGYVAIPNIGSTGQEYVSVGAEWASESATVSDMINKTDLVLVGKAKAKNNNGKIKTIEPFNFDSTLVYTEYEFNVKLPLKGNSKLNKVDVINYGGENSEGNIVKWDGIEQFDENAIYLLFLEKLPSDDSMENDPRSGKYRPVDGPAGIYKIESDDAKLIKELVKRDSLSAEDLSNENLKLEVPHEELLIQKKVKTEGISSIISDSKK